jgi:hypothetical protein
VIGGTPAASACASISSRREHGHAIERRIHRRQQAGDLILAALPQRVQSSRAILAAALGDQCLLHPLRSTYPTPTPE